jgi:hypothetical protein
MNAVLHSLGYAMTSSFRSLGCDIPRMALVTVCLVIGARQAIDDYLSIQQQSLTSTLFTSTALTR